MNELIMPEAVASQLHSLPHPVNLCDSSGNRLGFFVPIIDLSLNEIVGEEPSSEELARIEDSTEWLSTPEVLRRLEELK